MSFFEQFPGFAVIAHRGASGDAPENTLAAFHLAVEQGADAIELDAKLCADGEIVVIHDASVDRTTDGHGRVKHLRLQELKGMDAGVKFDGRFHGENIPTLADVFAALGEKIRINVELTNYASPWDDLPLKAGRLVQKFGLEERVLFSSFNLIALIKAARAFPRIPRALLSERGSSRYWWMMSFLIKKIGCEAFHPNVADVDAPFVDRMHRANFRVVVYTVNRRPDIQRMAEVKVDGIFTDHVLLAKKVLAMGDGNEY